MEYCVDFSELSFEYLCVCVHSCVCVCERVCVWVDVCVCVNTHVKDALHVLVTHTSNI